MRKLLLFMSVLFLGTASLFAQPIAANCYTMTNTTNCRIQICAMIGKECKVNGQLITSMIPDVCTEMMDPGKSSQLCLPLDNADEPDCHYKVMSYTVYNSSGEQTTISGFEANGFTSFLNSPGGRYVFPTSFLEGDCKGLIAFTHNIDGNIAVSTEPVSPVSVTDFCFKNETGCQSITFCVHADSFDDPCTPEIESVPLLDQCITLENGASGCVNFGTAPSGCFWSPIQNFRIRACGLGYTTWCATYGANQNIGVVMCADGGTPFMAIFTLENGVYVLRKL